MSGSLSVAGDLRIASRIGTGLGRLIRLLKRSHVGEELDRPSSVLLHTLVRIGPARVTTLAAAVYSDPSTVSRQAADLVGRGLLQRGADPGDGRASLLAVTDTGMALLDRSCQRRDERIAAIIESWQPAEREQFADLIDRLSLGYEANWCTSQVRGRPDPPRS